MSVSEMGMIIWISENTMKDKIWSAEIHLNIGVAPIDERLGVAWDSLVMFRIERLMQLIRKNEWIQVEGTKEGR